MDACNGGGDESSSSEPEATSVQRKKTKKIKKGVLSRSFKHWGGDNRPVAYALKLLLMEDVLPDIDIALLDNWNNYMVDKLWFVLVEWRPNVILARMNMIGAPILDLVAKLRKARARVLVQYGPGLRGLNADYSNIHEIAAQLGWDDSWWWPQPALKRKAKDQDHTAASSSKRPRLALGNGQLPPPHHLKQPPHHSQQPPHHHQQPQQAPPPQQLPYQAFPPPQATGDQQTAQPPQQTFQQPRHQQTAQQHPQQTFQQHPQQMFQQRPQQMFQQQQPPHAMFRLPQTQTQQQLPPQVPAYAHPQQQLQDVQPSQPPRVGTHRVVQGREMRLIKEPNEDRWRLIDIGSQLFTLVGQPAEHVQWGETDDGALALICSTDYPQSRVVLKAERFVQRARFQRELVPLQSTPHIEEVVETQPASATAGEAGAVTAVGTAAAASTGDQVKNQ